MVVAEVLRLVVQDCVGDLVRHDDGQLVVVLAQLKQPGKDENVADL